MTSVNKGAETSSGQVNVPEKTFGANTIWYFQFHVVCDKLLLSIWISSFV